MTLSAVKPFACLLMLVGMMAVSAWVVLRERPAEAKMKVYDRDLAEAVRVWDPKTGISNVQFGSCRLEKLRSGPIAFGGLDVLCIDGLVLNLPFRHADGDCEVRSESTDEIAGFPLEIVRRTAALPFGRVSGLRVRGVSVNRVVGVTTVPVFTAREMKNRGRIFQLSDCIVYGDGDTNLVGKATLTMKPEPVLMWKDGSRQLGDLFGRRSGANHSRSSEYEPASLSF